LRTNCRQRTSLNARRKGHRPCQIFPGKLEEWKRLTEQALEIVRTRHTGTLQYEIFFNARWARPTADGLKILSYSTGFVP
jgi:hypothetical protein